MGVKGFYFSLDATLAIMLLGSIAIVSVAQFDSGLERSGDELRGEAQFQEAVDAAYLISRNDSGLAPADRIVEAYVNSGGDPADEADEFAERIEADPAIYIIDEDGEIEELRGKEFRESSSIRVMGNYVDSSEPRSKILIIEAGEEQ